MQWAIEFGGDPQDVTVTTSGNATEEGFAAMNAEFVEHDRFRPGMLVLVDHTDLAVGELDAQNIRTIASDFVRHDTELGSVVAALVAPASTQFGLARMSTALAESPPNIRVFYTRREALEWLRQMREGTPRATP